MLPEASSAPQDSDTVEELVSVSCADSLPTYTLHETPFDMGFVQDFGSKSWDLPSLDLDQQHRLSDFPYLPTPLPSPPDLVELPQRPSTNEFDFPLTADGGVLAVPMLSVLRAFVSIATALNVTEHLWDPSYLHIMSGSSVYQASLPANLRPVSAQLVVPHHPSLDLLPWPSMRQKLICMLAMPSKLRPPIAREDNEDDMDQNGLEVSSNDRGGFSQVAPVGQSKAIIQLVQDLEDLQDGIRVHGNTTEWGQGNEFVEEAWEVGEVFYSKWWWCLDQKIIEQSNRRRRERGLGRLRIAT